MRQSDTISAWFDDILDKYEERIIDSITKVARSAGRISAVATAMGKHRCFADVAIAATAKVHDLTVVTRNVKHFIPPSKCPASTPSRPAGTPLPCATAFHRLDKRRSNRGRS
jgi:hypothetical protein